MDLNDIFAFRNIILNLIVLFFWIINAVIALDSCDISSASIEQANDPMFWTNMCGALFDMGFFTMFIDPSSIESCAWNLSKATAILVGKILLIFPTKSFIRYFDDDYESKIDRLFRHETMSYPINGTHDFEYCIDPRGEPPRCATFVRRPWNIPEMILALIFLELIAFLLVYWIEWSQKSMDDRHRSSIWWHRKIDSDRDWHDHEELIAFLTACAYTDTKCDDDDEDEDSYRPCNLTTVPVIDMNSSSNNKDDTDRLSYSIVIFECGTCESDNGIYLVITSDVRRKCRLVKISSTVLFQWTGFFKMWSFVHDGLIICFFEHYDGKKILMKLLLHNLNKDDSQREFDVTDIGLKIKYENFWCLHDDGREMGKERKDDVTNVRIVYFDFPPQIDPEIMKFEIRQCLLEIPSDVDGEIKVKPLQEITKVVRSEFGRPGGSFEVCKCELDESESD